MLVESARPMAPKVERPAGSRKQRILIVDDDEDIRSFCRVILEAEGFQCSQVSNGRLALEAAYSAPYDLVLLDIIMPEMGGAEVLQQLRKVPPCANLKILMFSGNSSPDEMAWLLSNGADDYLVKPFTGVQLRERAEAALRLKEAQNRSKL
jgi:DNA-binding response OmpR family regulator